MPEKRNNKRHLKRLNLMFGTDQPYHVGFTVDISEEGIFLKATKVYPPNTIVTIELSIRNHHVVKFQGQVRWAKTVPPNLIHIIKKAGMGIRIVNFLMGEKEYHNLVEVSSLG